MVATAAQLRISRYSGVAWRLRRERGLNIGEVLENIRILNVFQ
jgi:hypothetical protein